MPRKGGKYARNKGKRGELELTHLIPGAKRVGVAFAKTAVDIEWDGNVAQVKNATIGGTSIGDILEELKKVAPERKRWLIFKPRARKPWVICQTLDQFLSEVEPWRSLTQNSDNK